MGNNNEACKDIIDILLDENNTDPITLVDTDGQSTKFEQIAVIPFEEKIYCILRPVSKIKEVDLKDDEAIVFYVDEESDEEPALIVESDYEKATAVFDKYYDLLAEGQ
jgi:uncharacterized protein YrzB (UPF0473 family)